MPDPAQEYPLLRGEIAREGQHYQSPRAARSKDVTLPLRDPVQHRQLLLTQLDEIAQQFDERRRLPEASRELIAVVPEEAAELAASSFGDKLADARIAAIDPETGVVLIDAADPELGYLRRKLDAYADDDKVSEAGKRRGEAAVAPVAAVRTASTEDRAGPRFRTAAPSDDEVFWFELHCRGGYREMLAGESENTRTQVAAAFELLGLPMPLDFVTAERIVFFARLAVAQLRELVALVDCVLELDIAPREVVDWAILDQADQPDLTAITIQPPSDDAPSIVLLETGVTTQHPLLGAALLAPLSVVPGEESPEDTNGHGTLMAGLALYEDIAQILHAAGGIATHWLHSARVLVEPGVGFGAEANRPFWPLITTNAIERAEAEDVLDRPRVFATAITARFEDGDDPPRATTWSHALEQLAHNGGDGRLICVSAGNADVADRVLIEGFPQMSLEQRIQDPAFAANALTVGACTHLDAIPPHPNLTSYLPVAQAGEISPHTSCGRVNDGPIKPDIVCEGGNVIFDGLLPDPGPLAILTTGRNSVTGQPSLAAINATSAATANAARLASELQQLAPTLRPESIRGLLVHAADWTPKMRAQFTNRHERLAACGYGKPSRSVARACLRERATVVIEGELPNAVEERYLDDNGRPKTRKRREARFFRLPLPEEELLELGAAEAQLRVTLSYFAEPNTFGRSVTHGMDMAWRMQGPTEDNDQFFKRINKLRRATGEKPKTKDFAWEIGPQHRERGTVQSDRWRGTAASIAGDKLIAVYPVLGWWDARKNLEWLSSPFSLIVTVEVPGLDIYSYVSNELTVPTVIEVDAT